MNEQQEGRPVSDEMADLKALGEFARRYAPSALMGIAIAVALIAGVGWYRRNTADKVARASDELFAARSVPDLEAVADKYPSSRIAPLALLRVAKAYFNDGRGYDLAREKYSEFLQKYPDHHMARAAELAVTECTEAKGEFEAARAEYAAFSAKYPERPERILAALGEARCLTSLERHAEAKQIYDKLIESHPDSHWTPYVAQLREDVCRKLGIEEPLDPDSAGSANADSASVSQ